MWEHEQLEALHDACTVHFDVARRVDLLNHRLNFHFDHLETIAEYGRHQQSARLERIIIVLIALELLVGIAAVRREIVVV